MTATGQEVAFQPSLRKQILQLALDLLSDQYHPRGNNYGTGTIKLNPKQGIIIYERSDEPPMSHPIELAIAQRKSGLKIKICCTKKAFEENLSGLTIFCPDCSRSVHVNTVNLSSDRSQIYVYITCNLCDCKFQLLPQPYNILTF